jgi:hypothetical protein
MLPAGATVMFGPTALGATVALPEAPAVAGPAGDCAGAAEDPLGTAGDCAAAAEDRAAAAEAGDSAAADEDGAVPAARSEAEAGDSTRADDDWLAEQPATAMAATAAQAVAIFALI